MNSGQILKKIQKSPKYRLIYPKTIENLISQFSNLKNDQAIEEKVRVTLHQIWGAFIVGKLRTKRLEVKFKSQLDAQKDPKNALTPILRLHTSTAERLPILNEFYSRIFKITGKPKAILDLACGFNPLTLPWMDLEKDATYQAYDLHSGQLAFLKKILDLLNLKPKIKLNIGDVLLNDFPKTDTIFLFKFLPLVLTQSALNYENLINKLKFNHLVVSFPTKSLSGKEKGMINFYKNQILNVSQIKNFNLTKISFKSETVYILSPKKS